MCDACDVCKDCGLELYEEVTCWCYVKIFTWMLLKMKYSTLNWYCLCVNSNLQSENIEEMFDFVLCADVVTLFAALYITAHGSMTQFYEFIRVVALLILVWRERKTIKHNFEGGMANSQPSCTKFCLSMTRQASSWTNKILCTRVESSPSLPQSCVRLY